MANTTHQITTTLNFSPDHHARNPRIMFSNVHVFDNVVFDDNGAPFRNFDDADFCWNCGTPANHVVMGVHGVFPHNNAFFCGTGCFDAWNAQNGTVCQHGSPDVWNGSAWVVCGGTSAPMANRCPACDFDAND